MHHKAIDLKYLDGTEFALTFQDGSTRKYDVAFLFSKYPQLKCLQDRSLFLSGKLSGYGIIWNEELDIDVEIVYESGEIIKNKISCFHEASSRAVSMARAKTGMTQKLLAELTGMDQSDISKIERGVANPSVSTLERIASALGGKLTITISL